MNIQELSRDLPEKDQLLLSAYGGTQAQTPGCAPGGEAINSKIRFKIGRQGFARKPCFSTLRGKAAILLGALLFLYASAKAQIVHPVHWSYAAKKLDHNEAVVFLKATIDPGWHIYSAYQKEGGPVKTSFDFGTSTAYELTGQIGEPTPVTKYEPAFSMNVSYFENSVIFQQRIRLNAANPTVAGSLRFMVCNDHQCLPPETVNFNIVIK